MIDYIFYKLKDKFGIEDNEDKADKVIESSVVWSMGAGLIPIPMADLVAVTAIQVDMIHKLCKIYNVEFQNANLESWISGLSAGVLPKLGANAIKLIPGVGSVIGGVSMAILSGASTYATGKVFVAHFEKGGNLEDFNTEHFKSFYADQFEKGKELAKKVQEEIEKKGKKWYSDLSSDNKEETVETKQQEPKAAHDSSSSASKPSDSEAAFKKLQELIDLRSSGLITDAEFQNLKKKLMDTL